MSRQFMLIVIGLLVASAPIFAEEANPPFHELKGHEGSVLSVVFTLDGKTLVSSSRDHTIKIWDVASGELKKTLTNHTLDVYSVVFSHDGKLMASGGKDLNIILWDAATFEPIRTLKGHTDAIRCLVFSHDDKTL